MQLVYVASVLVLSQNLADLVFEELGSLVLDAGTFLTLGHASYSYDRLGGLDRFLTLQIVLSAIYDEPVVRGDERPLLHRQLGGLLGQLHAHLEHERGALVHAARVHIDEAAAVLYDLLADGQAHADAVGVLIFRPRDLAKENKQFVHFLTLDALARILDVHLKLFLIVVVGDPNRYSAPVREFERVLCQVDEHLLEADLVAD